VNPYTINTYERFRTALQMVELLKQEATLQDYQMGYNGTIERASLGPPMQAHYTPFPNY